MLNLHWKFKVEKIVWITMFSKEKAARVKKNILEAFVAKQII